jgi:hypothetical protein
MRTVFWALHSHLDVCRTKSPGSLPPHTLLASLVGFTREMPKRQRQNGLAEWEYEMELRDNEVDDRLWDGAHDDGWRIVPRAVAEEGARGTIRYTYVAPSGERLMSRTAAHAKHEGASPLHHATSDALAARASAAAAVQEAYEANLELVRSSRSATGFANVVHKRGMRKPFKAEMMVGTKVMTLGFFSTAEEAALCCARQRAAVPGGSERARPKSKAKPKVAPGSPSEKLTVGELPQGRANGSSL